MIQSAGVQKALTEEPRLLMETGNYSKEVAIMFGANNDEGLYTIDFLYGGYIRPNHLEDDVDFWKYDLVPLILRALGKTYSYFVRHATFKISDEETLNLMSLSFAHQRNQ